MQVQEGISIDGEEQSIEAETIAILNELRCACQFEDKVPCELKYALDWNNGGAPIDVYEGEKKLGSQKKVSYRC